MISVTRYLWPHEHCQDQINGGHPFYLSKYFTLLWGRIFVGKKRWKYIIQIIDHGNRILFEGI